MKMRRMNQDRIPSHNLCLHIRLHVLSCISDVFSVRGWGCIVQLMCSTAGMRRDPLSEGAGLSPQNADEMRAKRP